MDPELVARALAKDELDAEQAGFTDLARRTLRMAGGEFCVNATRAFGAMLDRALAAGTSAVTASGLAADGARRFKVTVSGWPGPIGLIVRGREPEWQVAAELTLGTCPLTVPGNGLALVRLPGISHLLVGPGSWPEQGRTAVARELMRHYNLLDEDAAGVIWWTWAGAQEEPSLRIRPVVRVRVVDTLYEETSCGSGSLALALFQRARGLGDSCAILQPGGDRLAVSFARGEARVEGRVSFVGDGFWQA